LIDAAISTEGEGDTRAGGTSGLSSLELDLENRDGDSDENDDEDEDVDKEQER
jgi:hypothetical protein